MGKLGYRLIANIDNKKVPVSELDDTTRIKLAESLNDRAMRMGGFVPVKEKSSEEAATSNGA